MSLNGNQTNGTGISTAINGQISTPISRGGSTTSQGQPTIATSRGGSTVRRGQTPVATSRGGPIESRGQSLRAQYQAPVQNGNFVLGFSAHGGDGLGRYFRNPFGGPNMTTSVAADSPSYNKSTSCANATNTPSPTHSFSSNDAEMDASSDINAPAAINDNLQTMANLDAGVNTSNESLQSLKRNRDGTLKHGVQRNTYQSLPNDTLTKASPSAATIDDENLQARGKPRNELRQSVDDNPVDKQDKVENLDSSVTEKNSQETRDVLLPETWKKVQQDSEPEEVVTSTIAIPVQITMTEENKDQQKPDKVVKEDKTGDENVTEAASPPHTRGLSHYVGFLHRFSRG
ncbi:uncharacterized protein PAC_13543 [Phialocephala subalpina]|uniref:Uncharacterized protein n=1 Tax=Phialocephala subalpina TaxID=576137 RepID=A0A1L7XF96_9HELO|nr:uncharacterized protein PAC_13543 [Phialocephala subalpina]